MADAGVKVGTNAGKVNIPDESAEGTEETLMVLKATVDKGELSGTLLTNEPEVAKFDCMGAIP